ncbi:uncharacterized protein [Lolium perenne]|uniref:uncharacterized protein n=1 Tax=Lolium perenne TaxID=4522 RepID=UPI0021F5E715|nr:uncharacterized protein LOC127294462 [Lolium perenne]
MQSLARSIIRTIGRLGSAPPRRWLPALARRDEHPARLFREEKSKLGLPHLCFSCATIRGMDKAETKKAADKNNTMVETTMVNKDILPMPIISGSSHRDGSIYKRRHDLERDYCVDIADRTETSLEPDWGYYATSDMMQFFSLKLAKSPINNGSIQLYGYIAARDEIDLMLNYVFNCSREDPIVVQQGSLIEMTGPKRGIALNCDVLLEFDMRIKNGEKEEDDAQLIDGMVEFRGLFMLWKPTEVRLESNCGAVDMSVALINDAITATVEVIISEVQSGFDLSLSSIISVAGEHTEFQLFHGTVGEWCGFRRFAIAVTLDTMMHLKFMVGHKYSKPNIERNCSFKAKLDGYASHRIRLELAFITVKVTWVAWPPV